jgi:cysteine desulfurase/selenocysteine lyase
MDAKLRAFFPILEKKINGHPFVYFDSAATALKPLPVIEALSTFYRDKYATVHRAIYTLSVEATELYEGARSKVAKFLNAAFDEIVFTRGTTDGLNMISTILGRGGVIQKDDEILLTEMEHHSNIVPWQMVAKERGAKIVVTPINAKGEIDLEAFKSHLSPKTKVVSVAHVSNLLGTVNPIQLIASLSHAVGALLVVDGAQGAPHLPVDVQAIDCDFYTVSGHKLYGPNGIGAVYGKKSLLEKLPPYQGGGDMIDRVSFAETTYNVPPLKFEAGTPIIAEAIALGAAIDFINEIGLPKIGQHEHKLSDKLRKGIKALPGSRIYGEAEERSGVTSFTFDHIHPLDMGTLLDLDGIAIRTGHLCVQPLVHLFGLEAICRVSFGLYNTEAEVDYFLNSIALILKKLSK